jgi:hypothetical protein
MFFNIDKIMGTFSALSFLLKVGKFFWVKNYLTKNYFLAFLKIAPLKGSHLLIKDAILKY